MSNDQAGSPPESSPMSLEDRIGNIFDPKPQAPAPAPKAAPEAPEPTDQAQEPDVAASEDPSPDGEPESETAPQFEEVEWKGKRFEVPPELKEAVIHASDYTKKTQEIAEQRRLLEFEQKKQQSAVAERKFAESVKDEISTLAQIDQQIAQYRNINVAELSDRDLSLMQYQVSQLKERKAETERALDGKYREFQTLQQKAVEELMNEGRDMLRKNIPNFSPAVANEIAAQFKSEGYSDEEIASSMDPRMFKAMWKAAQYDKLQSQKSQTSQKVTQAKLIGKAASPRPMPQGVRDQLNFRKALERAGPKGSQNRQAIVKDRIARMFGG